MSGTEHDWKFGVGDIIRECHELGIDGIGVGKSEYRITRQLRNESDGDRFYHVEKEHGGYHLYAAKTIENSYEIISVSDSRFDG